METSHVSSIKSTYYRASSGIGSVYADRFAQRGYHLILVARDTNRLDKISKDLQEKYGVQVEFIQADLSNDQDICKLKMYSKTMLILKFW